MHVCHDNVCLVTHHAASAAQLFAPIALDCPLHSSCMPHQKHHIAHHAVSIISLTSHGALRKRSRTVVVLQAKPLTRRRSLLP